VPGAQALATPTRAAPPDGASKTVGAGRVTANEVADDVAEALKLPDGVYSAVRLCAPILRTFAGIVTDASESGLVADVNGAVATVVPSAFTSTDPVGLDAVPVTLMATVTSVRASAVTDGVVPVIVVVVF
jgi:hypothetical protein